MAHHPNAAIRMVRIVDVATPPAPYAESTTHEGHAAGNSKIQGGNAMTRHSITTVLGSLFIGLFVAVNAPTVSANGRCILDNQANCGQLTAAVTNALPGQNPAVDAAQEYQQEMNAASAAVALLATYDAFHVASTQPAVAVSPIDYRAFEAPNFVP
jgi:hypothetical protein